MKAQISMEYLAVLGIALLMLLPLGMIVYNHINFSNTEVNNQQARLIAKKIVENAESVYYVGYPTKTTIRAYFPENLVNATIYEKTILFILEDGTYIEENSYVNLTGFLPNTSGTYEVQIQATQDQVNISYIK
jgi:hypothetical protein